ncbi:MAG: hypothetical protein ABIK68_12435 [bacterium]
MDKNRSSTRKGLSNLITLLLLAVIGVYATNAYAGKGFERASIWEPRTAAESQTTGKPVAAKKGILLFFLNPSGRPCQMQAQILQENITEIEKYVRIQAFSTQISEHRTYFYQFGIRQLPSLILLDAAGNLVHRFSPGIQTGESLLPPIQQLEKQ